MIRSSSFRLALVAPLVAGACGSLPSAPATPPTPAPDRPDLTARWCAPAEPAPYLIDLAGGPDVVALGLELRAAGLPKAERRRRLVATVERQTAAVQARLDPLLEELAEAGTVRTLQKFAVMNRLLVEADGQGLCALARQPTVLAIHPQTRSADKALLQDRPQDRGQDPGNLVRGMEERRSWAVDAVGAGELWQQGLDGTGVVVGILDSGVLESHVQLKGRLTPGGWLDPKGGSPTPRAGMWGHGTSVLSTAVAGNALGITFGMAPAAHWGVCVAFPDGRYDNVLMTQCADWVFRTLQPDVLINAWVLPSACDPSLRGIVQAWRAAEILPVFAAGNFGPEPGSGRSPADYRELYPGDRPALSVGALDPDGELYERSSRGPHPCEAGRRDGAPYPTLLAPGADLTAALPVAQHLYLQAEGTSFAAGVAAGGAALLIQGAPEAAIEQVEAALMESAARGEAFHLPTALGTLQGNGL